MCLSTTNPIPMTFLPYRQRRSIRLKGYDYDLPAPTF